MTNDHIVKYFYRDLVRLTIYIHYLSTDYVYKLLNCYKTYSINHTHTHKRSHW